MAKKNFKYIYGPVSSWRLGRSLGIDLLSQKKKICTFDCIYCQLGPAAAKQHKRKVYVPTKAVIQELRQLPKIKIDYITFSGRGEPTLAKSLGEVIRKVKKLRPEPVAVLTNASLLTQKKVRQELMPADLVAVKLDADSKPRFKAINRPAPEISFAKILKAIKMFRKEFSGKLALQVMLTAQNSLFARQIARLAQGIHPDEIQLCIPLRPCKLKPLSRSQVAQIKRYFRPLNAFSFYDIKRKKTRPLSTKKTLSRRGKL